MPAIPAGSTVLMTGATGCVGSGVVNQVLKAGYKIKAAVRNPEKAKQYSEAYNKRYADSFSTVHITDIGAPGALDEALKGCSAIIHTAGGVSTDDLAGAEAEAKIASEIAKSAAKIDTIKRFVYTSSTNALTNNMEESGHLSPSTWNEDAFEVLKTKKSPFDSYSAGKVLAERALFDFVEKEKPGFVLNVVNPNWNIGENLVNPPASTNGLTMSIVTNDAQGLGISKMILPQFLVSLVDDGLLHLAALEQDDVKGERLIGADQPFSFNDVVAVAEKLGFKDVAAKVSDQENSKVGKTLDNSRSVELLKRYGKDGFDNLETAVQQCVATAAAS